MAQGTSDHAPKRSDRAGPRPLLGATLTGMRSHRAAGVLWGLAWCAPLAAQQFHANEIFIPWNKAGSRGLNALLVYADLPGNRPLAVLTHGTSRKPEERDTVTAWSLLPQANWFARRGWTVLAVVRRGYGKSGGRPDYMNGRCPQEALSGSRQTRRRRISATPSSTARACRRWMRRTSSPWASPPADSPPWRSRPKLRPAWWRRSVLRAAEARARTSTCAIPAHLIEAFHDFGKHSRIPMLWIYAENDRYLLARDRAQVRRRVSRGRRTGPVRSGSRDGRGRPWSVLPGGRLVGDRGRLS